MVAVLLPKDGGGDDEENRPRRVQELLERRVPPDLQKGGLGIGVYVDGVAVIGTSRQLVHKGCAVLRDALRARLWDR